MPAMAKITDKQAAAWANTRERGRASFVWRSGVVCWGLPMAIVWPIAMGFFQGWDRVKVLWPISLILFPIGGIFFGRMVWSIAERNYLDYLKQHPQSEVGE